MRGFYCRSTSYFDTFDLEVSPRSLPLSELAPPDTLEPAGYLPGCFAPVLKMRLGKLELSLAQWRKGERRNGSRLQERVTDVPHQVKAESIFRSRNSPDVTAAGRCLIPAEGWHEWVGKTARRGTWEISPKNGGIIYLAGIWRCFDGRRAVARVEFSIVTEPANESASHKFERAPAVLWGDDRLIWLDPHSKHSELRELFGSESPDIFNARLVGEHDQRDDEKKAVPFQRSSTTKNDRFRKLIGHLSQTSEELEASGRVLEAACYRRDIEKLIARYPSL